MTRTGLSLIFLSFLPPLYLFWAYMGDHSVSVLFSQYAGTVSLIAMAWVQLMATRLRGMESIFGPLDQIYILHKWLAVAAIFAAFLHDSIEADPLGNEGPPSGEEATGARPGMPTIGIFGTVQNFAGNLGDIGYQGILILGLGSLVSFIPYHIWRWSHRLIGLFFAMAAVHYLLIRKPFDVVDPIGLYIALFCLIGIGSFLYLSIKGMTSRRQNYRVADRSYQEGVTTITLQPQTNGKTKGKGKAISYRAGQFAFLSFEQDGFSEAHPFTISSAPREDGAVRFSIASLGDYTSKLPQLDVGTKARISNGYGRFLKFAPSKDQIWISGGVGVTPFLAWLQSMSGEEQGQITFYYGVRSLETSPFVQELKAHAERLPNLNLKLFESDKGDYISSNMLSMDHGEHLKAMPIAFCGPAPMREALKKGLGEAGYPMKAFHYEEFQMRSGLGLRRLWNWLSDQLGLGRRLKTG